MSDLQTPRDQRESTPYKDINKKEAGSNNNIRMTVGYYEEFVSDGKVVPKD
jgi:hypothetical protein